MANCLLVGGGGFFGGHLTRRLLGLGHKVCIFDYKPYCKSVQAQMGLDWVEMPVGRSLEDRRDVFCDEYFKVHAADSFAWIQAENILSGTDVVYMLVGLLGSGPCTQDMHRAVVTNVLPMAFLIDALVRINAHPLVVHASSDLVYGSRYGLIAEDEEKDPVCGYAVTKLAAEQLLGTASRAYHIDSARLRISTTYGPYQERPSLINFYVSRALDGGELPVYGLGIIERDWLYIDDAVDALVLPLSNDDARGDINVPGDQRTLWQVANVVKSVVGRGHVEHVEWPELTHSIDVGSHVLDGEKIRGLGWELNVDLDTGVVLTTDWMRKRDV